jgi:hypothetical protein
LGFSASVQLVSRGDSLLTGGTWLLVNNDTGEKRPTTLGELVIESPPDVARQLCSQHLDFLARMVAAVDELRHELRSAFAECATGPSLVDPSSPIGVSCRRAAEALDSWICQLGDGLEDAGGTPSETFRLVLAALRAAVDLRSIVGLHRP